MTEQSEQACLTCYNNEQLTVSCGSGYHKLCIPCLANSFRAKMSDPETFSYRCYFYRECQSEFDPDFVRDLLMQRTAEDVQEIRAEDIDKQAVNTALRKNRNIYCPKCGECFTDADEVEPFEDLFIKCPKCNAGICVTCGHVLGPYGYTDHVCPADSPRRAIEELLTEATIMTCPNALCKSLPVTIERGDCNVITCVECQKSFCYVCGKDLGCSLPGAHDDFPHRNMTISDAPYCWLFNGEELDKTEEEASNLRKLHRISQYFSTLQITYEEKNILALQCMDLLGDLPYERLFFTVRPRKKKQCIVQ